MRPETANGIHPVFQLEVARGWKSITAMIGGCSAKQARNLARRVGLPVRMESGTPTLDLAEYLEWRRNLMMWKEKEEKCLRRPGG